MLDLELITAVDCPDADALVPATNCETCPYNRGGEGRYQKCGWPEEK
jgi:hypothetical protein